MNTASEGIEYSSTTSAVLTIELGGVKLAVLERRPKLKPDGTPESYPGCLQVLLQGWIEKTGAEKTVINRDLISSKLLALREEVPTKVQEIITRSRTYKNPITWDAESQRKHLEDLANNVDLYAPPETRILSTSRKTQPPKSPDDKAIHQTDITFGLHMRWGTIGDDVLGTLLKEEIIVLLGANDLHSLIPLDPKLHKKKGVRQKGKYGMHPDQIKAVKKALGVAK